LHLGQRNRQKFGLIESVRLLPPRAPAVATGHSQNIKKTYQGNTNTNTATNNNMKKKRDRLAPVFILKLTVSNTFSFFPYFFLSLRKLLTNNKQIINKKKQFNELYAGAL